MEAPTRAVASWLTAGSDRLRRSAQAVRLCLTAEDAEPLAAPLAWAHAAEALERAAGDAGRLEVAAPPEQAEGLLHVAVNELVKQGLRFLQMEYEQRPRPAYVAVFLPARTEQAKAGPAAHVLRNETTRQTWNLTPEQPVFVGRDEDCAIRVASPRASARHCALRYVQRAYTLIDLRSSAGTLLDNLPMRRGVIEEFGRVCLGRKESGHYLEMELRVPPGAPGFLHVITGANAGQTIPLQSLTLTVGRAPHCDLVIEAPYVSREHLRLTLITDAWVVLDLASTNGTVHNGRVVRGGRLVPGDSLEVGDDRFTFQSRDGLDGFQQTGWRLRSSGQEATLDRPYTTVGREPGCDFLAGDARVSRRHARLVWERPGRLKLYDLASFGGTTLDGKPVAEAELHAGDRVGFGAVEAFLLGPE
jgi:pSer/pThr/pTyr-binding forkhead associated (FHA) protein